jgi:DNA-binding XRE family transcriptional regulator
MKSKKPKTSEVNTSKKKMKLVTLEETLDRYIGTKETAKRKQFEEDLRLDILGSSIRSLREEQNLSQEELGNLIGVKKAQISKLENNFTDVRVGTLLRVFKALKKEIKISLV